MEPNPAGAERVLRPERAPAPSPPRRRSRKKWTILVVDDNDDVRATLSALLERRIPEAQVLTAGDGATGLKILAKAPVDLLISDYRMPGMDGVEFLARAYMAQPATARILVTAYPSFDLLPPAVNRAHIARFFPKPFDGAELAQAARTLVEEARARRLRERAFARAARLTEVDGP